MPSGWGGLGFLQWKPGSLPALGAFRIPRDISVTHRQGALGRIPGHPAVGPAIDNQPSCPIAAGGTFEAVAQIALDRRGKLAISCIRQPDAARNVHPRLLAPNRSGRQISRTRNVRKNIDESSARLPKLFSLSRRDDARSGERRWRRCAIILDAVAGRFRRRILAVRFEAGERDEPYCQDDGLINHGFCVDESPVTG